MQKFWWAKYRQKDFREATSAEPSWPPMSYFSESQSSRTLGPIDTKRLLIEFTESPLPVADIFEFSCILCCRRSLFEKVFESLISRDVALYDLLIDNQPYCIMRPTRVLDIFDWSNSRYTTRPDREPYAFRRICLKQEPPDDLNFFICTGSAGLNFCPIFSDRLRSTVEENNLSGLEFSQAWPRIPSFHDGKVRELL